MTPKYPQTSTAFSSLVLATDAAIGKLVDLVRTKGQPPAALFAHLDSDGSGSVGQWRVTQFPASTAPYMLRNQLHAVVTCGLLYVLTADHAELRQALNDVLATTKGVADKSLFTHQVRVLWKATVQLFNCCHRVVWVTFPKCSHIVALWCRMPVRSSTAWMWTAMGGSTSGSSSSS